MPACFFYTTKNYIHPGCINITQSQTKMEKSQIPELGSVNDKYEVGLPLGEGTFAKVFQATSLQTGEEVALKEIQVNPMDKGQIIREVDALSKVSNDHIIRFIQAFYDASEVNILVVALQLGKGSLRQEISTKKWTESELVSFITQMTSAFLDMGSHGVMHLDLKPENILVSRVCGGCYKVCDFGCSQVTYRSKLSRLPNGEDFGTFNYLAPENYVIQDPEEMIKKLYHTKSSSDMWSMGVILYEMIYKRLPFAVDKYGKVRMDVMKSYVKSGKQLEIQSVQGLSVELLSLLKKMLKAYSNERITWLQLKDELIKIMGVEPQRFLNTKKTFFKHFKLLKVFISMTVIIRKNCLYNPHQFWQLNKPALNEMADLLIHLSYLYSRRFNTLFGYKINDHLQPQWIKQLQLYGQHIQSEEEQLCNARQFPLSTSSDLKTYEQQLLAAAAQLEARLKMHDKQTWWESMLEVGSFFKGLLCQQHSRNPTFFAKGDDMNFGDIMRRLQIRDLD